MSSLMLVIENTEFNPDLKEVKTFSAIYNITVPGEIFHSFAIHPCFSTTALIILPGNMAQLTRLGSAVTRLASLLIFGSRQLRNDLSELDLHWL